MEPKSLFVISTFRLEIAINGLSKAKFLSSKADKQLKE